MRSAILRPLISALFIIVCAVGFTVYASQASGAATSPLGPVEYRNSDFGFSLLVPPDMTLSDTSQGNSLALTFMSETGKQFLIVASPYSQVDIAAGEYGPHDAYGTEDQGLQLRDVTLLSEGDTSQILFVKNGIMYDIITMEGDEKWLVDILKTWQFD